MSTSARLHVSILVLTVVCGALAGNIAAAQTARSGGGGGNDARLQAMVNQLNGEKANLQRENDELSAEVKKLKADLAKAQSQADSNESQLANANASAAQLRRTNESAQLAIERYKEREQELLTEFRKTVRNLSETESEKNRVSSLLAATRNEYRTCARHNVEMFDTAIEVLDAYENKGLFTRAAQGESLTQLARVRVENIVDEYRYALEDQQLDIKIFEDEEPLSSNP